MTRLPTGKRRLVVFAAGVITGALTAWALLSSAALFDRDDKIDAGTTVLGVVDEEIMALSFVTEVMTVSAQRAKTGAPFAVQISYADGRRPRQCLTTPDLDGQLASFASIQAIRQVPRSQVASSHPTRLGILQISDRIVSEPIQAMVLRTTADRKAVALVAQTYAVEIAMTNQVLTALTTLCPQPSGH